MGSIATNNTSALRGRLSLGVITALLATYIIWGTTYLAIRFVEATLDPMRRRQILDLEIVKPPLGSGLYLREYFLID